MPTHDAIILGAGPAGLSAALKLAALGRRAVVLAGMEPRGHRQLETVPHGLIITHSFPGMQFAPPALVDLSRCGVSWWTGIENATPAVTVLDRAHFDAALMIQAWRAGVEIHEVQKETLHTRRDTLWHVSAGGVQFRSHFLLDATGRHSRFRTRQPLVPWRQACITGEIALHADAPGLWTESLVDGWLWAIRVRGERSVLALFVDASFLKEGRQNVWQRALSQSRLRSRINALPDTASLTTLEVTPSAAGEVFADNIIHFGDAALARDPLASQGLTAAISDGQSVAVAVHTLLSDSSSEALVRQFVEERHRKARQRHLQFLSESYAEGPFETAFWIGRGGAARQPSSHAPVQVDLDRPLVRSTRWKMRDCPVLENGTIRLAPCLCSEDEAVRWLAGCPVQDLLPAVNRVETPRSLLARWTHSHLVQERTAIQVLTWFTSRGVFEQPGPGDPLPQPSQDLVHNPN